MTDEEKRIVETFKLSKRDRQTIRLALNYAADERDGLADAYGRKGPEAQKALAMVKRFRKLHLKLFDEVTQEEKFLEWSKDQPTVPVLKLLGLDKSAEFNPPTAYKEGK